MNRKISVISGHHAEGDEAHVVMEVFLPLVAKGHQKPLLDCERRMDIFLRPDMHYTKTIVIPQAPKGRDGETRKHHLVEVVADSLSRCVSLSTHEFWASSSSGDLSFHVM